MKAGRFPLLKTRQLPQPYVRSMGDTAHVDTKRMVDVQERRSANGLRKVEDPYMVKQRLQKVTSHPSISVEALQMRKEYPLQYTYAGDWTRHGYPPCIP